MKPQLLHIRKINDIKDDKISSTYRVYVRGTLVHEVDELTPGDMCRLFADVYGVPTSMDIGYVEDEQPTVLTEDHLDEEKVVVFDAIDYPSAALEQLANILMARALTVKILEAAKAVDLPPSALKGALRIVDNPQMPGVERMFAIQRGVNPKYASFVGAVQWIAGQAGAEFIFSDILVEEGEFGRNKDIA